MAIEDRRERERAARRQLIVDTARSLAEADGWEAVTTRRLATEIEYSQPVIYKHFAGMDSIADAVAVDGFEELARSLRKARSGADDEAPVLTRIAQAYLDFARDHPAVYDAMFTRSTALRFAADDTPRSLDAAFAVVQEAVREVAGHDDPDTTTEVFWSALHGLVTLARAGRLRADHEADRLTLLVEHFQGRDPASPERRTHHPR